MTTPRSTLTVWVEAEAVRGDQSWNRGNLLYAKVGRLLRHRPNKVRPDTHLVRVDIEVPHTVFEHRIRVSLDA